MGQLGSLGYHLNRGRNRAWASIVAIAQASAARGAYGLANRALSISLGQGGKLGLNPGITAATEAASAYNQTRVTIVSQLPRRVREELWVRRETAGDPQVCDRCLDADGLVAPADVGVQPSIPAHAKCRCSDTIISKGEAESLIAYGWSQKQD